MAQLVAHHTGSVGVTGSNPVSSTFETIPGRNDQGFCFIYLAPFGFLGVSGHSFSEEVKR